VETFVVRVFVAPDLAGTLCGVVQHVETGRSEPFSSAQDLISIFLASAPPPTAEKAQEERPL
jgi:hypothetical protein